MSVFPSILSSPRLLLLATLTGLATPVPAAIYKCQEAGDRTSYQQAPCPNSGAAAKIRSEAPNRAEEDAARQRGNKDKAAAEALEREQEARRREARREFEDRQAARQQAEGRCAKYLEDAETLVHRSQTRKKPQDRERDERKAEGLRNRHFSECYVAGR